MSCCWFQRITDNDDDRRILRRAVDTDYVVKAVKRNGLLDYSYAGKTVTKLYELGLEAGQQWLLAPKKRKRKEVV